MNTLFTKRKRIQKFKNPFNVYFQNTGSVTTNQSYPQSCFNLALQNERTIDKLINYHTRINRVEAFLIPILHIPCAASQRISSSLSRALETFKIFETL